MSKEISITKPVLGSWRWLKYVCLVTVISLSMITVGCTAAQWEAALNEVGPAVGTILEIVALSKGGTANLSTETKIEADTAALDTVITSLLAANDPATKQSLAAQVNANFAALENDLNDVYTLSNVSDPVTESKITLEIGLIAGLVQIVEAAIPGVITTQPASLTLSREAAKSAKFTSVNQFVKDYNANLVAPTGNKAVDSYTKSHQLHIHSWFVRKASLGFAK
jgi:hypothetical protein